MWPACSLFPRSSCSTAKVSRTPPRSKKTTSIGKQCVNCHYIAVRMVSSSSAKGGVLAEVLKKNRVKHYNAVVSLISDAQERKCFGVDFTEDSHPDSVK